jgi:Chromo (CHRromatin Organisation MOdifier) domain
MDHSASKDAPLQSHSASLYQLHGGSIIPSTRPASLLSPYNETPTHGPNFLRPPPDLIDDAEEYEVERVVDHRHHGRKKNLQYLLKWKGYPESDNTWEPAEQVHSPELVKDYHRKKPLTNEASLTATNTRANSLSSNVPLEQNTTVPRSPQIVLPWKNDSINRKQNTRSRAAPQVLHHHL